MKKLTEDQFQQILDQVPIDDIIAYMKSTNWTWYDFGGSRIPDRVKIISTIGELVFDLDIDRGIRLIRAGGFEVCLIEDDKLSIAFKLEDFSGYFWQQTFSI